MHFSASLEQCNSMFPAEWQLEQAMHDAVDMEQYVQGDIESDDGDG